MRDKIECNGVPVCISVTYVTHDRLGWRGETYVGTFHSLKDVNENMETILKNKPEGWKLELNFQDDPEEIEKWMGSSY